MTTEEIIKHDNELMHAKELSHTRGMNLGFLIGFITGASVAAVLILLFKLYN